MDMQGSCVQANENKAKLQEAKMKSKRFFGLKRKIQPYRQYCSLIN
jgi:hypothetical protein